MDGRKGQFDQESVPSPEEAEVKLLLERSLEGSRMKLFSPRSAELAQYLQQADVLPLARTLEDYDPVSARHCVRAAMLALDIAEEMGIEDARRKRILAIAGVLHDIGKLKTPPEVLTKPEKHTDAESVTMRKHVRDGIELLKSKRVSGLEEFADILAVIGEHHEHKRKGSHPRDKARETGEQPIKPVYEQIRREISPELKQLVLILVAAENFDALLSERPYRPELLSAEQIKSAMDETLEDEVAEATAVVMKRYA